MLHVIFILFIVVGSLSPVASAWASFEVLDVNLTHSVKNRVPINPVTPPAHCEKDQNGKADLPIVDSSAIPKIFFWTRIASTVKGSIRHTWHQQSEGQWKTISKVDLGIRPSAGYRMWSTKTLKTGREVGDWMIVVAPSDDLEHILCITRFRVK